MENNQYPNHQPPTEGQTVAPETDPISTEKASAQPPSFENETYIRAQEATTQMAQPVGMPYDCAADETQVYPKTMQTNDATTNDPTSAQPPQNTNAVSTPSAPPTGKTKRKKHGNFGKFLAVLLIGALIGGAAGGAAGYYAANQYDDSQVVSAQEIKNAPKDSNGNLSVTTIAEHAMPAVVSVYNMANVHQNPFGSSIFGDAQKENPANGGTTAQGYGSGVLISADGLIVTNYHVIADSDSVVVNGYGDKEYKAQVLGTDPSLDLAVLKIEGKDFPYVNIANSDKVKVGDLAVAIGNPLGSEFADTVTDGIISGVDRKISSENGDLGLLQTNASINNGNSGGALLNGQGQLIGINSMKIQSTGMTAVEGMGFAIPSNTVLDFVNSVKDGSHTKNSTKKAWIGITGYSMNESIARQLGTDQNTGILIASVTEDGPAAKAGLQQADIIVKADDTTVETFEDLSGVIAAKQPGDTIELGVIRDGQTGTVTVTLDAQH